ncbi:Hypothetical predicted protein [Cloeon dipterum]|uniref:Uncharacterized protein n=1 Tax=Cloeon dipterum TaxID=197152 RepID=A0A8S1D7J2_9INSE|nr:Hypothetical predicted protein [Cloeon dipterum]
MLQFKNFNQHSLKGAELRQELHWMVKIRELLVQVVLFPVLLILATYLDSLSACFLYCLDHTIYTEWKYTNLLHILKTVNHRIVTNTLCSLLWVAIFLLLGPIFELAIPGITLFSTFRLFQAVHCSISIDRIQNCAYLPRTRDAEVYKIT